MTDIAKLLKEAPYGMELYSTLFGNVYLKGVSDNDNISVYDKNKVVRYFNKYGQFFEGFPEADCQLFPAKEQSWEDYNRIVNLLTTTSSLNPYKFKVGDWIISREKDRAYDRIYQITDIREEKYFYDNTSKYDYINVADKVYELWNINDAKPGDMLVANGAPFIYKSHDNNYVFHYCGINLGDEFVVSEKDNSIWNNNTKITPANQMQCDSLLRKMEDFGYVWDPDKKVLSKKTKFKIGDWIVHTDGSSIVPIQVYGIKKDRYLVTNMLGTKSKVMLTCQDQWHLWTIDDAKNGDFVVYKGEISIFKHNIKNSSNKNKENSFGGFAYYYCWDGKTFFTDNFYSLTEDDKCNIRLATLEERELIHSQMANSGYEWDPDKKVLSKKAKFKIGDWVVNNKDKSINQITETICDEKDPNTLYGYVHTNGFFVNAFEDVYHLWTIKDAKDGDILSAKIDGDDYILIFKQIKDGWIETYGHYYITIDKFCVPSQLFCRDYQGTFHPATQKERYLLFKKMREAGFQWYAGKKDLKKIQSHYDIANFYTGMPVLVRDTNSRKWCYLLYSHYDNTYEDGLCFNAGSVDWRQCIPFNEKTKYLLGTTDMCPEEYVNWRNK